MATEKQKSITETGPVTGRQLQKMNAADFTNLSNEYQGFISNLSKKYSPASLYDPREHAQQEVASPFIGQQTRTGGQEFWGNSAFDDNSATLDQFSRLSDIRAENQPWYSKLVNGIGKAGILAGTTALETIGLLYGVGQGAVDASRAEKGKGGTAFLHGLWDNPITRALQNINEYSEEYMPNYYTKDEMEDPFGNIFTANFLGDKLIKNMGFMVGAFYGGIPASAAIGKIGQAAVRGARASAVARAGGVASRLGEITASYADDVIGQAAKYGREIAGLSKSTVSDIASKYSDDAVQLYERLAREGLTESERGKRMLEGLNKINNVAQATRATTQTIGALGSAINEGAIEALNNSKDWANEQIRGENEVYQQVLENIQSQYGGTEMEAALLKQAEADHQTKLAEIEKGRARMGNADLLLNLPILLMSNLYQLGHLYTRGFDSTRREMGSLLNGHKLKGSFEKGTLGTSKTRKGAALTALYKSNTEGLEEYLQRAASDGSGQAVTDSINRFMAAGTGEEATNNVNDYIVGFGKAIADNLGDPNAWEEYMIGALSSAVGMPVFGSQTKNAYGIMKDNGVFGFAGGLVGNYNDYMDAAKHEKDIADYLNKRIKDPDEKFKELYDVLRVQDDYDKWLREEIAKGDKSEYHDLNLEKFYKDINAAASSGHLAEFKALVGFNDDYTDEELESIIKMTSRKVSPEDQAERDKYQLDILQANMDAAIEAEDSESFNMYKEEYDRISEKLDKYNKFINKEPDAESPYETILEGPFIERNEQMNVTNPDKMREILERNRKNLLQGIDDYLKIRNDIDVETDGRLEDKDIELLTMLRGHIYDYEKRSAEMADDLVTRLGKFIDRQNEKVQKSQDAEKSAQEALDKAQADLDAIAEDDKEGKTKAEKIVLEAKKILEDAKAKHASENDILKLLNTLVEDKDTTQRERAAEAEGMGAGFFERAAARFDRTRKRKINSEEIENIFANYRIWSSDKPDEEEKRFSPKVYALQQFLMEALTEEAIDFSDFIKLTEDVADLGRLANKKLAYRRKVGEYLGDFTLLNDAYKGVQDQITQQEKDNKSEDLSLSIRRAGSMAEIDSLMRDARQINTEIAEMALSKAKQSANEDVRKTIEDWEKGSKYRDDLLDQASRLPNLPNQAFAIETITKAWNAALTKGLNVYDTISEYLKGTISDLETLGKSGEPGISKDAEAKAKALKDILKELNTAKSVSSTNKTSKKEGESKPKRKGFNPDAFPSGTPKKASPAKEKAPAAEGHPAVDSEEDLRDAIIDEISKSRTGTSHFSVSKFEDLTKELQDRINSFNAIPGNHIDFTEVYVQFIHDELGKDAELIVKEDIEDGDENEYEEDSDSENSKANEIKEGLSKNFTSDRVSEYDYNEAKESWRKKPHVPSSTTGDARVTAQLEAIQKILKDYKAYQFVDKNYLGYIASKLGADLEIHFLMSTDPIVNGEEVQDSTIFLAIKWTAETEKAVYEGAFNGEPSLKILDDTNVIRLGDNQYQIVGAMSFDKQNSTESLQKAFSNLLISLNEELSPKIEEARSQEKEGDEGKFVVSDKTTIIASMNTGRLEKATDAENADVKHNLIYFIQDSNEYQSGMNFYFGVVINNSIRTTSNELASSRMQRSNNKWATKNNGAILLYVPRPDGKLYPIRCTRRTVGEWMADTQVDGAHSAEELLNGVLDGSIDNKYFENIVNYLKTLFNESADIAARMDAMTMLHRYFVFGKDTHPIHFNNGIISLELDDDTYTVEGGTYEEMIHSFFDALKAGNIQFSLPSPSIEEVDGRSVIESGVFETGVKSFYNFGANFVVFPIGADGKGVVINDSDPSEDSEPMGGRPNESIVTLDIGDGLTAYYKDRNGTFFLNGAPVDDRAQSLLTMAERVKEGTCPFFKEYFINELSRFKDASPEVRNYLLQKMTSYDNIYIVKDENTGELWIYNERKSNHKNRFYNLEKDSKGKELVKKVEEGLNKVVEKNQFEIVKMTRGLDSSRPAEAAAPEEKASFKKRRSSKDNKGAEAPAAPKRNSLQEKSIKDLDAEAPGVEGLFARGKKNPHVRAVFAAYQVASPKGLNNVKETIDNSLEALLDSDKSKEEKDKVKDDLINALNNCKII